MSKQGKERLDRNSGGFPGGPVVKTLHFQCTGHRFDPWLGAEILHCCLVQVKNLKKKIFFFSKKKK